ncbi:hypothetical protein K502DRAFT_322567 [Neoconidiobolus thromboides FSU 785]|nr:hypothetical protein K502DRAFT_322567 [Neoconidiobolus thromboides FSU 785]
MAVFPVKRKISRGTFSEKIYSKIQKNPFLFFGLPFITIIVGASFAATNFTQTRYDYQKTRLKTLKKKDMLKLDENKRQVNLQEEYWKLMESRDNLENWEIKRVERDDE